jgi:hypothetical protein
MRYKNPTPNPLPASDEGAKMYLIRAKTAVSIGFQDFGNSIEFIYPFRKKNKENITSYTNTLNIFNVFLMLVKFF